MSLELLPASILAQLRRVETDNRPETGDIQSGTEASDGSGGTTVTWATTTADVPLRISPASRGMTERIQAMGYDPTEVLIVSLPLGTDVSEPDRIIVGDRTVEVIGVLGDYSYEGTLSVVVVER